MGEYERMLSRKEMRATLHGFEPGELNQNLFDWQRIIVTRACRAGRYAIFADCGLGKTLMQLETIRRAVRLWSNPGEVVLSPFGGIGSEPYVAVEMGRKAVAVELKPEYFDQMCANVADAERSLNQTSLF